MSEHIPEILELKRLSAMPPPRPPDDDPRFDRRIADPRVIHLEGRLETHESVCAERMKQIQLQLSDNKESIRTVIHLLLGVTGTVMVMLITGFAAVFMQLQHSSGATAISKITGG